MYKDTKNMDYRMKNSQNYNRNSSHGRERDRLYERDHFHPNRRRSRSRDRYRRRSRSRDGHSYRYRNRSTSRDKKTHFSPERGPNEGQSKLQTPYPELPAEHCRQFSEFNEQSVDDTATKPDSSSDSDPNVAAQKVLEMLRETTGTEDTEYELDSRKLADYDAQSNALDVLSMLRESKQETRRRSSLLDTQAHEPTPREVSVAESSAVNLLKQLKTSREARQKFGGSWVDRDSTPSSSSFDELPAGQNLDVFDETKFRKFNRKRQSSVSSSKSSESIEIDLDVHSELEKAQERESLKSPTPSSSLTTFAGQESQPCTLFDYSISSKKKEPSTSLSTSINRRARIEPSAPIYPIPEPRISELSSVPVIPLPIPKERPKFSFSIISSLNETTGLVDAFQLSQSELSQDREAKSGGVDDYNNEMSDKRNTGRKSEIVVLSDDSSNNSGTRLRRQSTRSRSHSRTRSSHRTRRSRSHSRTRRRSRSLSRTRLYRPRSRSRGHSRSPVRRHRSRSRSSSGSPPSYRFGRGSGKKRRSPLFKFGILPSSWRNRRKGSAIISATSSNTREDTTVESASSAKCIHPDETLMRRQKDIDYMKVQDDYKKYLEMCPKNERRIGDPITPNIQRVCSRRAWDGGIKAWKISVHSYIVFRMQAKQNEKMKAAKDTKDVGKLFI